MFGGSQNYEPLHTGKKIVTPHSRKQPEFSIGWNQGNQLNSYQLKNTKNQDITGKIGTQGFSESKPSTGMSSASKNQNYEQGSNRQPDVLKPINSSKMGNSPYDRMDQRDSKMIEYERLLIEYPDIPVEELQRIVLGYEEKSYVPQQSNTISHSNNRSHTQSSGSKKDYEAQSIRREEPMQTQQRAPIKPRESMKDIIYGGGEIGSENENPQKVIFRVHFDLKQRNNTNLILGDGYNYFKNGQ